MCNSNVAEQNQVICHYLVTMLHPVVGIKTNFFNLLRQCHYHRVFWN